MFAVVGTAGYFIGAIEEGRKCGWQTLQHGHSE